jgi:hypothetical protein
LFPLEDRSELKPNSLFYFGLANLVNAGSRGEISIQMLPLG